MSDFNKTIDLNNGLEKILERIDKVTDDLQKRETKNCNGEKTKKNESDADTN